MPTARKANTRSQPGETDAASSRQPLLAHSFSSARAEALLSRMRATTRAPVEGDTLDGVKAATAPSPTMYTTLGGFTPTGTASPTFAGTATANAANVSAQLLAQVQVVVEQVSGGMPNDDGGDDSAAHRVRRIRLTQELLSGCAALGFTPSMVMAGVPTILEQFALAAVKEKPAMSASAAGAALPSSSVSPFAGPASGTLNAYAASSTDALVAGDRFLPPLVDQVQLMTDDGIDALAMDTYLAPPVTQNATTAVTVATTKSGLAPSNSPASAAPAAVPACMRSDATAADVLIALLELCGMPLTYLTLQDQQCLPLAVEALALSCAIIATHLDAVVVLLDERATTPTTAAEVDEARKGAEAEARAEWLARARALRRVRLAALDAVEKLLCPFAQAALSGAAPPAPAPHVHDGRRRRHDRPASAAAGAATRSGAALNTARAKRTVTTISRAISTSAEPVGMMSTTATSAHIAAPSAATAASPMYEPTVVAAMWAAMDVQGFVSALSGPLLGRWAAILQEAAVVSVTTAELSGAQGSATPLPSSRTVARTTAADGRSPYQNEGDDGDAEDDSARELLVVSYVQRLRLDSAQTQQGPRPEQDFQSAKVHQMPSSRTADGSAEPAQRHCPASRSSDEDEDEAMGKDKDKSAYQSRRGRGGEPDMSRDPPTPLSAPSSTAAAHQRLVLSRREEEEIGCLLRIFGHLFSILELRAAKDEAWQTLIAPTTTSQAAQSAEAVRAQTSLRAPSAGVPAVVLHPLLPVLAVRTLSWALPGDYCASLTMDLLSWMLRKAPQTVSRSLLYHVEDARFFHVFEQGRSFDVADGVAPSDKNKDSPTVDEQEDGQAARARATPSLLEAPAVPEPCALESLFDALVVQLNASHRLQQRELRNDLITLITSVLIEDGNRLRAIGLARRAAAKSAVATTTTTTTTSAANAPVASTTLVAPTTSTSSPLPLPPRAVDAVNAIVLTMFNLLCTPELNLVVSGLTDALGEGQAGGSQGPVPAATATEMLEMLEMQLPLLSVQTLTHYTVRFNGVASPSQRREFLQFKRLGWQLLATFSEWQAARVYFEGSRYVPRATKPAQSAPSVLACTTYEGLYLVDLCLLGFLDVLLLYVDVDCRVAAVVAWMQEELVTLQDEAWQLMCSLVENAEELRQLFALDWELFTLTLAKTGSPMHTPHGLEVGHDTPPPCATWRASSLRSSSLTGATSSGRGGGGPMPDDHELAAALKASSRFSSAPPPRRTSALLTGAVPAMDEDEDEDEGNNNNNNNNADDAHADRVNAPNAVANDAARARPALRVTPSVLKGPDAHLLEAGAVDVALRYVRLAPVRVEALKHKAVQLLDAIARSASTTSSARPDFSSIPMVDELEGSGGLHMSLNARLTVHKYSPTLVRALLARTPGLVGLLVHILQELQAGTPTQKADAVRSAGQSRADGGMREDDDDDEVFASLLNADPLAMWHSPASASTPFSLSFLQSASSSLLALVCVHFLQCLGESAKEEVGGIHELDALHHKSHVEKSAPRSGRADRLHTASFLTNVEDVMVVDMGYEGGRQLGSADDEEAEDEDEDVYNDDEDDEDDEEAVGARHSVGAARAYSLKPMAAGPTIGVGFVRQSQHDTSFRDVMKLGYEFEDAGGVALLVTWMKYVLLPNPTEAIAVGARLDLTGTATTTQATLCATADPRLRDQAPSRAPPLQESHLFRQLDMLVALFGVVRGLILGSEHTERAFVVAGGVSVLLEVAEALAVASNALLPIPECDDAPLNAPERTQQAQTQQQQLHADPHASPAALARLKAALSLAMIRDPTPVAAAARGDRRAIEDRQTAFAGALRYALALLADLLYTSEQACQALLRWRSRRIEKYALSTGGATAVKTTHDVFMNAVQLLISLWSTALGGSHGASSSESVHPSATRTASSPTAGAPLAGLEVIGLRVRTAACALLREEYVRRFLRTKLTLLYPEDAADILSAEGSAFDEGTEDEAAERRRLRQTTSGGGGAGPSDEPMAVEPGLVDATAALLSTLDMVELFRYYLYSTGQDEVLDAFPEEGEEGEDEAKTPNNSGSKGSHSGPAFQWHLADHNDNNKNIEEENENDEEEEAEEEDSVAGAAAIDRLDVRVLRRRARHQGSAGRTVESLVAVLRSREKAHCLYTLAVHVATSDRGSERRRQRQLGQLLRHALGLGEKVYSCLASLGFEHLISHATATGGTVGRDGTSYAADNSASQAGLAHGDGDDDDAAVVSLSPSERSHLISIAALPALCMDELCVAMAAVAAVFYEDVASTGKRPRRASAATMGTMPQSPRSQTVPSLPILQPPYSPNAAGTSDDVETDSKTHNSLQGDRASDAAASTTTATTRMRPTSPDRRCLQGVLTDVYARGHEICQLVHLGHEASETQEQQLYDRFLITRLKQPVRVMHGNTQTLLAQRDATYGAVHETSTRHHSHSARPRGSSQTGRRRSSGYMGDGPHVVVPLSPGVSSRTMPTAVDPGMSALANRLAARMTQSQREQEARQLLQSLSGAPATAAAAAVVTSGDSTRSLPRQPPATAARDMFLSASSPFAQQLAMGASGRPRGTGPLSTGGTAGGARSATTAASSLTSQPPLGTWTAPSGMSAARTTTAVVPRAPQPPPPSRARALVSQRRKKEEMVRNSLKRLPQQQRDMKPQDASTVLVDAVLKDARHTS